MSTKFSNLEYLVFDRVASKIYGDVQCERAIVKRSDISVISHSPVRNRVTLMIRGGGRLSERYLYEKDFLKPFGLESMEQFFDEFL